MAAFIYPAEPHKRRHGPQGYAAAESYRPWLRDEFSFRCVYCLLREQWGRVRGTFEIDHFQPIVSHPDREMEYDNLVYGCAACNAAKGRRAVPDPLYVLLDGDVQVEEDGTITARTPEARRLVRMLGLDDPEYTEFRMLWIGIVALAGRHEPGLYRKLLGFPDDLPNLGRLRPPGGNTRPEGLVASYFSRRNQDSLRETY